MPLYLNYLPFIAKKILDLIALLMEHHRILLSPTLLLLRPRILTLAQVHHYLLPWVWHHNRKRSLWVPVFSFQYLWVYLYFFLFHLPPLLRVHLDPKLVLIDQATFLTSFFDQHITFLIFRQNCDH